MADIGREHVHTYEGITTLNFGHVHNYQGVSSPAVGGVDMHTHTLQGITSINNAHTHEYSLVTSPALAAGPTMHYHYYYVVSAPGGVGPHVHLIMGATKAAINT
ncbi:MAG: YmaF family protein [Candidatus Saccharibacteria bacterium]